MTDKPELTDPMMQRILAAVGKADTDQGPQPQCEPYDWKQPHYFTEEQLCKIEDFTNRLAIEISLKFTELCHSDFDVSITSRTQHFTDEILEQAGQELTFYYTAFGHDPTKPWAIIGFSHETAVTWATQMLGDTETDAKPRKELSSLERSLLDDISAALVEAFCRCHQSFDLKPTGNIIRGNLPFEPEMTDSLCKIVFQTEPVETKKASEAYILLPCEKLEPIAGKIDQAAEDFSEKQIAQAITERLYEMSLPLTVRLDVSALSMAQAMQLEPGDVIVLDKAVDQPAELVIEDKRFFFGHLAKTGGRKAVRISEFSNIEKQS